MTLFACIIAYLLGSVPNGLLLCRAIWHIDIREHGSRNIGAAAFNANDALKCRDIIA